MAATPPPLGELLTPATEIFRACTNKNFLKNPLRTEIRDTAYYRKPKDTDGLSLGLTAEHAVHDLENFGVIAAIVRDIHAVPRGLEVRIDPDLAGHALLHGLPYKHENEQLAEDIAWELVRISHIVYNTSYYPPGHRLHVD